MVGDKKMFGLVHFIRLMLRAIKFAVTKNDKRNLLKGGGGS